MSIRFGRTYSLTDDENMVETKLDTDRMPRLRKPRGPALGVSTLEGVDIAIEVLGSMLSEREGVALEVLGEEQVVEGVQENDDPSPDAPRTFMVPPPTL